MLISYKKIGVIFVSFLILFLPKEIYASDAADTSKISITVTEKSGKDLKDYQIQINLNEDNFSFEADKNKLSFSDENNANLNYWIEEWDTDSKEAKIWVKIPELKANKTKTIYMDLNGSDLPNGDETFDFFDDFEGSSLNTDKWSKDISSNYNETLWTSFENSILKINTATSNADPLGSHAIIKTFSTFEPGYALRAKERDNTSSWYPGSFGFGQYHPFPSSAVIKGIYTHKKYGFLTSNNSYYSFQPDKSNYFIEPPDYKTWPPPEDEWTYDDKWHIFDILWQGSSAKLLRDGGTMAENTKQTSIPAGSLPITVGDLGQWGGGSSNTETNVDWIFVRKYVSPEPEATLGDDLFIKETSLLITKKGANTFLIKGKLSSAFKEDLKNITIAAYDKNPGDNSSKELARVSINKIEPQKDADFEITVSAGDNAKINELYVFADPDNKIAESNKANNIAKKKIPDDTIKTIKPLLVSIAIFILVFLILSILYYSYKISKKNKGAQKPIFQTKTCLKCGMVLDKNQSKCPVCGMEAFKK